MKKIKLNQCQDCGCPGSRLLVNNYMDGSEELECPYCGRKGRRFWGPKSARGNGKVLLSTIVHIKLLCNSWNPYNRANEEGLA